MSLRPAASALAAALAACTQAPAAGPCRGNLDCAHGLVCVSGACVEAPPQPQCEAGRLACNEDPQCGGGGARCVGGCCVPGCVYDDECPDGLCSGGTCVPRPPDGRCTTEADCVPIAGRPKCHVASKTCVECLRDDHCPVDSACGLDHVCRVLARCSVEPSPKCAADPARPHCDVQSGRCVACLREEDCSRDGSWTCNLATKSCETPATGCTSDTQCAGTTGATRCLTTAGRCVNCLQDLQCAPDGTKVCDLSLNMCRPCRRDSDCARSPAGARCRTRDHRCVRCTLDDDCLVGTHCLSDNNCGSYRSCGSDRDCSGGARCRRSDHVCVECMSDYDCPMLFFCSATHCLPMGFCSSDADCRGIYGAPRCDGASCVECLGTSDCGGRPCTDGVCG